MKAVGMISNQEFRKFIDDHTGIIIKVCRIYTDTEDDFKDCFQEVTLQLWKSHGSFKGEAKWSTWVYRVALNVCLLQLRSKKRRLKTEPIEQPAALNLHGGYTPVFEDAEERIKILYSAIKKLRETDRAIILLYLEEKSYKEIAEIMGLTVTNVGVKVSRIKNQLKNLLDGRL